ncbi:MAG: hypothetical protein K9M10_02705 [Candidatus Pacebacteria bacterium]|nr:hypothetical protein [Candidatus Paceibacterota bacterium]MCF7857364.1 hypothetical protein [Candidatus Paceibacterota bacterium]
MEKLNILVIEDNVAHQQAAQEQLSEHNLTIVGSFPEALRILGSYSFVRIGKEGYTYEGNFDVVLTDMEMPVCRLDNLDRSVVKDISAPYGLVLALRAAQVGVKYVAMITDTNHHQGAMSNALDMVTGAYWSHGGGMFQIGQSKVLFAHAETKANTENVRVKQWHEALKLLLG